MKIAKTIAEFRQLRSFLPPSATFIPTMGNLHSGHLHLVSLSRGPSIVSIFVNPAQFAPTEDFDKYPRTLESDIEKLQAAGVSLLFTPSNSLLYPSSFLTRVTLSPSNNAHPLRNNQQYPFLPFYFYPNQKQFSQSQPAPIYGQVGDCDSAVQNNSDYNWLNEQPEAICRPGFFDGVATVLTKLFNIAKTEHVVFGQKDAVQCIVVKQLIRDFNFDTNVIISDIVREEDSLAMSSRNQYLSREDRSIFGGLMCGMLNKTKSLFETQAVSPQTPFSSDQAKLLVDFCFDNLKSEFEKLLKNKKDSFDPKNYKVEYVSLCDWEFGSVFGTKWEQGYNEGIKAKEIEGKEMVMSLVVRVGGTRLLDNVVLKRS